MQPLDRYFRELVGQDIRRLATACFIAVNEESSRVSGYYTLSSGSVPLTSLPEPLAKRMPRYPSVPIVRLGRLAVDLDCQGQKLGTALLWDALSRVARSELIAYGSVVDVKDDLAEQFYQHHGFLLLAPRQLLLPFGKIAFE